MKVYKIKDWSKFFEGAKSKKYKHQTKCIIPNKQNGLGYKRLLKMENGESLYGAFIAVCLLLSRQEPDRQGYLTDTGRIPDTPLTPEDISLMTGFKETTISEMLDVCSTKKIGWIEIIEVDYKEDDATISVIDSNTDSKDTTRIPQGYHKDTTVSPLPQLLTLTIKKDTKVSKESDSISLGSSQKCKSFFEKDIDEIYKAYPKKVNPRKAKEKIKLALKRISKTRDNAVEYLLSKTKLYAEARKTEDKRFTPNPATWYHGGGYDSDPETWSTATNTVSFIPPTVEEVEDYMRTRSISGDFDWTTAGKGSVTANAQAFVNYYEAQGWKTKSGVPVVDWEATIRRHEDLTKAKGK